MRITSSKIITDANSMKYVDICFFHNGKAHQARLPCVALETAVSARKLMRTVLDDAIKWLYIDNQKTKEKK